MTNEELKKKIVEVLRKRMSELLGSCHSADIPFDEEGTKYIMFYANEFADALIAAGLKFDVLTETEYQKYCAYKIIEPQIKGCLDREKELEKRLAEAEHRAEVAERALGSACKDVKELVSFLIELAEKVDGLRIENYSPEECEPKAYINRAEKELAEEGEE